MNWLGQIHQTFLSLGKGMKASAVCVYGGVDQEDQIKQLQSGASILIATPGRMFDLLSQGMIDVAHLKILVLDEANHMLDLGFIEISRSDAKNTLREQNLFFSATLIRKLKS